jgi:hypothetical protein
MSCSHASTRAVADLKKFGKRETLRTESGYQIVSVGEGAYTKKALSCRVPREGPTLCFGMRILPSASRCRARTSEGDFLAIDEPFPIEKKQEKLLN